MRGMAVSSVRWWRGPGWGGWWGGRASVARGPGPEPVRVHAGGPGGAADAGDDAADEVPVQRAAVVGDQALVAADVLEVGRGPGGEQLDELGVQRDVAVIAELAQRDPQPVPGADEHDRVGVQAGQLAGPHARPGQQFDDEPVAGIGAGPG